MHTGQAAKYEMQRLDLTDARIGLLIYGGFLYFKGTTLLSASAFCGGGDGLQFGGPTAFTKRHIVRNRLEMAGRMQVRIVGLGLWVTMSH